jgi:hypothetical protein
MAQNEIMPGLEVGMLLYHIDRWAKVICEDGVFGIQWCNSNEKIIGVKNSYIHSANFAWKIAGSDGCPQVPEEYKYEPPNNQGRFFCFWCDKKVKIKYVKKFNVVFHYCPECKR